MTREISAKRLEWLHAEVAAWQRDGVIDEGTATALLGRYRAGRKASVIRLISAVGAAFVGVGLISLVASNLDQMSPLLRFTGIAVVWLGAVLVAELLLRRDPIGNDGGESVAVGVARVIAVAAYGATVFQAAQSLQVPAYSSGLLGCWAFGALAYAYATGGVGPLLVGMATAVGWSGWSVGERADSAEAVIVALAAAAVFATAVAGLHERSTLGRFGSAWASVGALLSLVGLFAAAMPIGGDDDGRGQTWGYAVLVVAFAAASVTRASNQVKRETAAAVVVLAAAVLLTSWQPDDGSSDVLTSGELARAVVATALYLATAVWYAVAGVLRDRPALTNLATAALVVFVTVQSFGVFAPLLSGAALFLVLGVVLIGVGALADRGRRRIIEEVAE